MAEITLQADTGRPTGSRASGRLRAQGKVPGVVYGLGRDPQPVAVVWRDLRHALVGDAGMNALIDLQVDGTSELVIVKELQRHPVRRDVLHVDFLRVSRDQAITVEVPVVLTGEAQQVAQQDGVVDQVLFALAISAKPADIPNELTVDITDLEVGGAIRVGDLQLPAGVTTDVDTEEAIVTASVAQVADLGEGEAAEGEEAEGEAAEGGAEAGDGAGGGEAAEGGEGGDGE